MESSDEATAQNQSSNLAHSVNGSPPTRVDETSTRLKRTACVLCRKRKLKCDAARPKCSTCQRLGHECEYNEIRKKSGPKRGYVKALEARLASVETQLKSTTDTSDGKTTKKLQPDMQDRYKPGSNVNPQVFPTDTAATAESELGPVPSNPSDSGSMPFEEKQSWDMIALGLEEPLPSAEVMNELYELYFKKIHPSAPMINRGRFLAALSIGAQGRPPIALRYAMWALAAGLSDQYGNMQEHFYRRARKYAQQDEMAGFGEGIVSLYFCQAWVLIAIFEFKNLHFPRAWLSTGRAVRLGQMMGLHRLDGQGLEVKQCLQPPVDWTEKEERRRTFWMLFWEDRCASIGTGWPMTIDEQDILTNLPASDQAFASGVAEQTPTLLDVTSGRSSKFSNFAGSVVLTSLFGRNLHHLHRPGPDDREHDLNGAFWERHRELDATLLNLNMNLPDEQRIPHGLPDPNVIYVNMCIQTSLICLHQAAIYKIDKNNLPSSLGHESKVRCVTAAAEITTIMRSVSHCELATMNPFTAFCLYVASRVFVQYLKSRRNDQSVLSSLNFLLSAMHAMKRRNALNESFLAQLEVDLESANITTNHQSALESLQKKGFPYHRKQTNECKGCALYADENAHIPEPSTTIPTNMQANIGSSNVPEMTLPLGNSGPSPPVNAENSASMYHFPDASMAQQGEFGGSYSADTEEMDFSSGHSGKGSTPSVQTHRSCSTTGTVYTPPELCSLTDSSTQGQQLQPHQENDINDNNSQIPFSFWSDNNNNNNASPNLSGGGNVQMQNTNFYQYDMTDGPGMTPRMGLSVPSPMNQQEFDNLTKQFFATTPGGSGDPTSWLGGTGMTPLPNAASEEWNQVLEAVCGWDNSAPRGGEAWAMGRGA